MEERSPKQGRLTPRLTTYQHSGGTPALLHVSSQSPIDAYKYLLCQMNPQNIKLILISLLRLYKTVDTQAFLKILQAVHRLKPLNRAVCSWLLQFVAVDYQLLRVIGTSGVTGDDEWPHIYMCPFAECDALSCREGWYPMSRPGHQSDLHERVVKLLIRRVFVHHMPLLDLLDQNCGVNDLWFADLPADMRDLFCKNLDRVLNICREVLLWMPPLYSVYRVNGRITYLTPHGLHGHKMKEAREGNSYSVTFTQTQRYLYQTHAGELLYVPLEAALTVFLLVLDYDGDWFGGSGRTAYIVDALLAVKSQLDPERPHIPDAHLTGWVKFVSRCFFYYCASGAIEAENFRAYEAMTRTLKRKQSGGFCECQP